MILTTLAKFIKKIMFFSFALFLISCSNSAKEINKNNIEKKQINNIEKKEVKKNNTQNYSKIYFDFNSNEVKKDDIDIIQKNANIITENNKKVTLEGNCDIRGNDKYNNELGYKRANSVKEILIKNGIPENNINVVSNGKTKAEAGKSKEIHQKNRNVTFVS